MNKKLDKILKVLNLIHPKKVHTISKAEASSYSFDTEDHQAEPEAPAIVEPVKTLGKKTSKKKATVKKTTKKAVKKTAVKKKTKKAKG